MIMTLNELNNLSKEEAGKLLSSCCGSSKWSSLLMKKFPFKDENDLVAAAEHSWYNECAEADWLEAFTQIGRAHV